MRALFRAAQFLIPPCILWYIGCAWVICAGRLPAYLGHGTVAKLYFLTTNALLAGAGALFLRLIFLPSSQGVPPPLPPAGILTLTEVFECEPPAAALQDGFALVPHDAVVDGFANGHTKVKVNANANANANGNANEGITLTALLTHCDRDACAGRWKPARARHCSMCGTCRMGFDHHCAFLANCITAAHLRPFLALLFSVPIIFALLGCPLVNIPLLARAKAAWNSSDPSVQSWYAWPFSWIVPLGPLGRWGVGTALGWRALDAVDGGGEFREQTLGVAAVVAFGAVLSLITFALGYSTLLQIRAGILTVDRERARALKKATAAAWKYTASNRPVPPDLADRIGRFTPHHWFFVPTPHSLYAGVILRSLPAERPYDFGRQNTRFIVGSWRAFLPWNAWRAGLAPRQMLNWPIAPEVHERLEEAARRIVECHQTDAVATPPRRPGPDRLAYIRF